MPIQAVFSNAVFLIQLESWEAALTSGFARPESPGQTPQALEVAKLLGWVRFHSRDKTAQLNLTVLKSGFADDDESPSSPYQALAIAKLLGWVRYPGGRKTATLNDTARAPHTREPA
jgi:hypothetical protein